MTDTIGILAYGSLIDDPGNELSPKIIRSVNCITPFPVEYARKSGTRGNAPTLIPVEVGGLHVSAKILLLDNISKDEAIDMLWRRETRKSDITKKYPNKSEPKENDVVINVIKDFSGINTVLYTSIGQNITDATARKLADLAIESYFSEASDSKLDGVHYLMNAKTNGIKTALSDEFENEILKITESSSLQNAIDVLDIKKKEYLSAKKEIEEFEKEYREIGELIHTYGVENTLGFKETTSENRFEFVEKNWKEFKIKVHEGFKLGQWRILASLLKLEAAKGELENTKKLLKGTSAKQARIKIDTKIKRIEEQEAMLRHLIDSIVWQLINGQLYIARRLFQGVEGKNKLVNTNIESVRSVVDKLNAEPENFALITDLSSYVQTGDILLMSAKGLQVIEVKEGEKNEQIYKVLDSIINAETTVEEVFKDPNFSKNDAEHLSRSIKQMENSSRVLEIINTDKGKDKEGNPVTILTPEEATPIFDDRLYKLEEQLNVRNFWAYDVIEECLHVGLYKGHMRFGGYKILEGIAKEKGCRYVMADYRSVVHSLNRPAFTLPFSPGLVYDILFRNVIMVYMLNLDAYLKLYDELGVQTRWLTKKETGRLRTNKQFKQLFIHDGQAIEILTGKKEESMYLFYGTLQRIFFELIYPSYIAYTSLYYLQSRNEEKTN